MDDIIPLNGVESSEPDSLIDLSVEYT